MIVPDKQKFATNLLAKLNKDGSDETMVEVLPEEDLDPTVEGQNAAAEDVMLAFKSGSASELAQALRSFFDIASLG